MIGEKLSGIYEEIEDTITDHEFNVMTRIVYTDKGVRGALKIFSSVLMSKMWELQEKEGMPQKNREIMAEAAGFKIKKIMETFTGLNTHDFYKSSEEEK